MQSMESLWEVKEQWEMMLSHEVFIPVNLFQKYYLLWSFAQPSGMVCQFFLRRIAVNKSEDNLHVEILHYASEMEYIHYRVDYSSLVIQNKTKKQT